MIYQNKHRKLKIWLYLLLILTAYIVGVYGNVSYVVPTFKLIPYTGIFLIFFLNLVSVLVWIMMVHFGIFYIMIFRFIQGMVVTGISFGDWVSIYFRCSLTHGVGELLVGYIIFAYSMDYWLTLIHLYKTGDKKLLINRIKYFCLKEIPLIVSILLVSAILEICVSNRLIVFIYNKSLQ